MDRLTDRNSGYLVNDKSFTTGYIAKEQTGAYSKDVIEEAIDRLAAYEDTGLTPEQVNHLRKEVTQLARESVEREKTLAKLETEVAELAQAKADGRLEKLSESQRRERAAVEDLIKIAEYSGSLTCHCNEMIKIAKAWRCPEDAGERSEG